MKKSDSNLSLFFAFFAVTKVPEVTKNSLSLILHVV